MKQVLYIFSFLFSLTLFSQEEKVFVIGDSTLAEQWSSLSLDWRYHIGDNLNWAKPEFDDSEWDEFSNYNLNRPDNENAITERGEIAWFRKRIKAVNTLNDAIVLRVYQTGASEIYLDGVRIHSLGTVNTDIDDADAFNPPTILTLPLVKNKEQLLAIRFQNIQSSYPVFNFNDRFNGIVIQATSLSNVLNNGLGSLKLEFINQDRKQLVNNLYTAFGIGLVMFILFICLYLFFPRESINGYFSLSLFFFCALVGTNILDFELNLYSFKHDYGLGLTSSFYLSTTLYCIYKIFNQTLGYLFWSIIGFFALNVIAVFFISAVYLGPLSALICLLEIIRISYINRNNEKFGAIIFLIAGVLNLIFWTLLLLNRLTSFNIPRIIYYQGYAYCLVPIGIAIYLGYKFGKRSEALRLKLEEVQTLSKEKETILSKQNETLEKQVRERTAKLNQSLEYLKATQSQLIQSEKMASLGELTAGIAHEIQNPLNFVNNFSEVSNELIDEMNEEIEKKDYEEVKAIAIDIKQNLEKITHHGKRADNIVKGMLQHSRSSTGKKEPTDINALADEYLRLAYHGLRAKDKSFNAELVTDFDEAIGKINVLPQDMGRVILNLITNAFYAVNEKKKSGIEGYQPTVTVSTKLTPLLGGAGGGSEGVEITISDNGMGIPKEIVDKIFQPFFTTKPTGQGTGLGLSMSYDIVTKGHGGELKVETKAGEGTTFSVVLPIAGSAN